MNFKKKITFVGIFSVLVTDEPLKPKELIKKYRKFHFQGKHTSK